MGLIDLVLMLATCSGNMHSPAKAFHMLMLSHPDFHVKSLVSTLSASPYLYTQFAPDIGVRIRRKFGLAEELLELLDYLSNDR